MLDEELSIVGALECIGDAPRQRAFVAIEEGEKVLGHTCLLGR
jgi:hypothetical protein